MCSQNYFVKRNRRSKKPTAVQVIANAHAFPQVDIKLYNLMWHNKSFNENQYIYRIGAVVLTRFAPLLLPLFTILVYNVVLRQLPEHITSACFVSFPFSRSSYCNCWHSQGVECDSFRSAHPPHQREGQSLILEVNWTNCHHHHHHQPPPPPLRFHHRPWH
jgi:hypothetical protein